MPQSSCQAIARAQLQERRKTTVQRLVMHEQVALRLRDLIVKGQLEPGERLRVSELAERLNVSLTPMREALKVLAEEQLVELTPNRPTRITPITVEGTRDLFEVTAEIESLGAELAAARMSTDNLKSLEILHAKMRNCHNAVAIDDYFDLNNRIHDLIVDYAGNPILIHMRSKLELRARRVRFGALQQGNRREEAMQEHENVMAAFRDKSPQAARDAWRLHFLNSGAEACRLLQSETSPVIRGESSPPSKPD